MAPFFFQLAAERSETIPRLRDPKGKTGKSSQSDIGNLQLVIRYGRETVNCMNIDLLPFTGAVACHCWIVPLSESMVWMTPLLVQLDGLDRLVEVATFTVTSVAALARV